MAATTRRALSTWQKNLTGKDNANLIGKRDPKWWFTGKLPQNTPGFDGRVLRSLPPQNLSKQTRQSAMAFFDNGWTLYETLFASLQGEEAFFIPPAHGLRHPMQFYYGHTAALYLNKLLVAGLIPRTVDREFEAQFEVGVDEMCWDDDLSFAKCWPAVSEVKHFRKEAYEIVKQVIDREFASASGGEGIHVHWDHPLWAVFMGCEHDRIHLETSAVLIRELPLRLVSKPDYFPEAYTSPTTPRPAAPANELVPIQGRANVVLGKPNKHFPTYGWDNEYGRRVQPQVPDFACSKFLVSNGEFLDFVLAKGYLKQELWTEEGWQWRRFRNTQHPQFWTNSGPQGLRQDFKLRHMFEVREMDWSLPAIVNYHEAKAFCNWKASTQGGGLLGARMPTEHEHQLLLPKAHTCEFAQAEEAESPPQGNHSLAFGSETPVDYYPPTAAAPVFDAMGNVWQWTENKMRPLAGFEPHAYYLDFTEPCFDDRHQVIKGGSFVSTCDNGVSPHSRFHFRQHFHQMAGFRYCVPSSGSSGSSEAVVNVYETQALADQYLDLHFSVGNGNNGNNGTFDSGNRHPLHFATAFPRRCAELVIQHSSAIGNKSAAALDVGCAVGGASFVLADHFDRVVGVDYSQAFVDLANCMRTERAIYGGRWQCPGQHPERTHFVRGDACAPLQLEGEQFDAVLAANLLCRLPHPQRFLDQLPALVAPGGIAVLVSPYSWLGDFTPDKHEWIGQVGDRTGQELKQRMHALGFDVQHEQDMPLVIKEHARKFQYIESHAVVFRRRAAA